MLWSHSTVVCLFDSCVMFSMGCMLYCGPCAERRLHVYVYGWALDGGASLSMSNWSLLILRNAMLHFTTILAISSYVELTKRQCCCVEFSSSYVKSHMYFDQMTNDNVSFYVQGHKLIVLLCRGPRIPSPSMQRDTRYLTLYNKGSCMFFVR